MGRAKVNQHHRVAQTRSAIGFISDLGGAAVALSMLAAGVVGAGSVLVGLADGRPSAVFFGGGVLFGVGVGTGMMSIAHVRRASSVEAQRGYRWVEARFTYRIDTDDPHRHTQMVDVKIRALRDGVRTFTNHYRWSGSGRDDDNLMVKSPGHSLNTAGGAKLGWRAYEVKLDPALRKGQETTVSIVQEMRDDAEGFELFLAKSVHEKMDMLVLRVELPATLAPRRAWCIGRAGAGPEARQVVTGEPNGHRSNADWRGPTIEWRVHRPVQGLNYELYWDYLDDRGLYDLDPSSGTSEPPPAV